MIKNFTIAISFDLGNGKLVETHQTFDMDLVMLDQFKGDEKATVRVGVELSDKKFGSGVSISGAVTLTVNQDDTTIETAFNYGASLLRDKIKEVTPELNKIYEQIRER